MHNVPDDKCWSLEKNKDKRPEKDKSKTGYSKKEFDSAVSRAVKQATKDIKAHYASKATKQSSRKRRHDDSDSDDSSVEGYAAKLRKTVKFSNKDAESSSDDESVYTPSLYAFYENSRKKKKGRKVKYTAEIIVKIEDRDGDLVPIRALLDTGTTDTIVLRKFVKKGRAKSYKGKSTTWNTMGGKFTTNQKALIDFKFPELDPNKKVTWVTHVDSKTDQEHALYDIIIGMDLMTEIGIFVNTETKEVVWEGHTTPLVSRGVLQDEDIVAHMYHMAVNPVIQEAEERQARILDADYSKIDIEEYFKELQYLSVQEQDLLASVLSSFPTLFGGGLGRLNIDPIHLELKPDAVPYAARPFPVPQSLHRTTKVEMNRLTGIQVFEKNSDSEWAAPTFVQPKKTGDVRILTDFRRLNECLVRKPFPLPRIADLLQKLRNFKYATAIDLSMGYYHIPLDEASQRLCTTVLPWGKYRYKVLPMGIKNSPDIFQEIMTNMFIDLEYTSTYLDDILVISDGTFEDHMMKVKKVLQRLEAANFRANVRKCFFAQDSLEYLGYQISRKGIQPQPKKVEAIMAIKEPKNVKQLRHFLGMVNYYRDMWQRRSHILAPLTKLVGKGVKFTWDKEQQKAFDEIKRVMSKETILAYPDFKKPFHIYTDASNTQLGAVIMQEDKPLAFYSRKMNSAQKNYTTGEQKFLSIVETLKEFQSLLWGQELIVYTDHKNIIYGNLSNDRITQWRLLLEEYSPTFLHIKGVDNVVADALSRLDKNEPPQDFTTEQGHVMAYAMSTLVRDESTWFPEVESYAMAESFAKQKDIEMEKFPMSPALIQKYQRKDKTIDKIKDKLEERTVEDVVLKVLNDKIVLPK